MLNEVYTTEFVYWNTVLRKDFGRLWMKISVCVPFFFCPLMRASAANISKVSTTEHLSPPVAGRAALELICKT